MLKIDNPLSEEQSVMRRSLLPGLLNNAVRNQSRRNLDIRLFEMGNVFIPAPENPAAVQPQEILHIGMLLAGAAEQGWLDSGEAYDFYHLKGVLEAVLDQCGLRGIAYRRAEQPFLHPGRSAEIWLQDEYLGLLGEVHPQVAANYQLTVRVIVAELAIPPLYAAYAAQGNRAHDLPRYPASYRDIAVIGSTEVAACQVEAIIRAAGGEYLVEVRLFDLYDKPPISAGQRSLAYALQFRSEERTLTDQEVDEAFNRIVAALSSECGYQLR
jgi:phenylalanyl-tRNA synthetase beta chain